MAQKVTDEAQKVYNVLRQAIIEQSLQPDTRLPEELLSRQFKASRHAVRSALQMLATERVVSIRQNKGASIAAFSPEEGKDILRMRIELEDIVVRSVVGRLSANDILQLRDSIKKEHATVDSDPAAYNGHACAFHRRLAELAGSEILKGYLTTLLAQSSLVFYAYGRPRWKKCNSDEHTDLLNAIESGDLATARNVMRTHLESLYNRAFSDEISKEAPSLESTLQRYVNSEKASS